MIVKVAVPSGNERRQIKQWEGIYLSQGSSLLTMSSSTKQGNPVTNLVTGFDSHTSRDAIAALLGLPIYANKGAGETALAAGELYYVPTDGKIYAALT